LVTDKTRSREATTILTQGEDARWVERILSLKETCRLKSKLSFQTLVDLVNAYFKEQEPDGIALLKLASDAL